MSLWDRGVKMGNWNDVMGPRNVNNWTVQFDCGTCNVIMVTRNVNIGPWNMHGGPWNVNRGPWNVIRGCAMSLWDHGM